MPTITKRGKSFQIVVSMGLDVNGKKIRKTTTFKPPGIFARAVDEYPEMVFTTENGNYVDRSFLNTQFRKFVKVTHFFTLRTSNGHQKAIKKPVCIP